MNIEELDKQTPFTRITIESVYSRVEVEVPEIDLTFQEFYESVLEPALLAHGYGQGTLDTFWTGGPTPAADAHYTPALRSTWEDTQNRLAAEMVAGQRNATSSQSKRENLQKPLDPTR